jgi:hypothetical protein
VKLLPSYRRKGGRYSHPQPSSEALRRTRNLEDPRTVAAQSRAGAKLPTVWESTEDGPATVLRGGAVWFIMVESTTGKIDRLWVDFSFGMRNASFVQTRNNR